MILVLLDTSGVATFGSSYNYTVSTTIIIKVNGTVADRSSIGSDLVADMTTLIVKLS